MFRLNLEGGEREDEGRCSSEGRLFLNHTERQLSMFAQNPIVYTSNWHTRYTPLTGPTDLLSLRLGNTKKW